VYILWARLGSVSTRYSALRAYLSSHCIKGRSKPVPWYRNWGAWRWRSQNGGSKKLPGGISSTGSAATWTSWFFRKISIDLGDLLDSRWVIIPSSFMAFNHENVQMRANAGCDWADITNEIIIENFQFPEMRCMNCRPLNETRKMITWLHNGKPQGPIFGHGFLQICRKHLFTAVEPNDVASPTSPTFSKRLSWKQSGCCQVQSKPS
jgi:hypothetical protein